MHESVLRTGVHVGCLVLSTVVVGCATGEDVEMVRDHEGGIGGQLSSTGGDESRGGATYASGGRSAGGFVGSGGASTGSGGSTSLGGSPASQGGAKSSGGSSTLGGATALAGAPGAGGKSSSGGALGSGGKSSFGGAMTSGGAPSSGGVPSMGGITAQGDSAVGGSGGATTALNLLTSESFEGSSVDGWFGRGTAVLSLSTEQHHGGAKSLKVSGRTAAWHGAEYDVKSIVTPGESYSVSVWARLTTGTPATSLQLTRELQGCGATSYLPLATVAGATDADWVELSGTLTIAANCAPTKLSIYVESASATASYFVDDTLLHH